MAVTSHVCVACGAKFRSYRMGKHKRPPSADPRYCDACRRNNSRWGKGYTGPKQSASGGT